MARAARKNKDVIARTPTEPVRKTVPANPIAGTNTPPPTTEINANSMLNYMLRPGTTPTPGASPPEGKHPPTLGDDAGSSSSDSDWTKVERKKRPVVPRGVYARVRNKH